MRNRWFGPAIILAMWAFALAVYPSLPDRVPTHWNFRGEVDGWSSRSFGAFLNPVLAFVSWGLLFVLPRIDPRRHNYARFRTGFSGCALPGRWTANGSGGKHTAWPGAPLSPGG